MKDTRATKRLEKPADHDERLAAARAFAQWHLGYADWATQILAAYFDPVEARRRLEVERGGRGR